MEYNVFQEMYSSRPHPKNNVVSNKLSQSVRPGRKSHPSADLRCSKFQMNSRSQHRDIKMVMEMMSAAQNEYFEIVCTLLDEIVADNDRHQVQSLQTIFFETDGWK